MTIRDAMKKKRWVITAILAIVGLAVGIWAFVFDGDSRTLRIHVETIRDEEGRFHQRWTCTSGARWESYGSDSRGGENIVVLEPPGQYDAATIRFLKRASNRGANKIIYEVEARREPTGTSPGMMSVLYIRTMRGNAGGMPALSSTTSTQWPDGPWRSRFKILQAEDAELPLPARVRLGVFGDTTEVIEFR